MKFQTVLIETVTLLKSWVKDGFNEAAADINRLDRRIEALETQVRELRTTKHGGEKIIYKNVDSGHFRRERGRGKR